ncbi:hypothetical protein CDL15_Pgr029127 [Punica granatum]|uniref:Urease accessory protein D n=1 Tax=Punica granatum TaxID=22663 RepID=A0A218XLD3_PUNGR|nr:hypothetical protein CDL15_Pgr029127 [Punica granatum]
METGTKSGEVRVEKVGGKSMVTKCFSKYPLKFIIPKKAGPSKTDSVWIYSLTYGGGIVSVCSLSLFLTCNILSLASLHGDVISSGLYVGDGSTTVLTTQASTKVYKSLGSKCSEQLFEKQVFRVVPGSSLVLVDWITSGRHESGEVWDFNLYKSTNNIFFSDGQPLFLDTVLLEQGGIAPLAERMQDYRVIAMVVLLGPKLRHVQIRIQEDVKTMMSGQLRVSFSSLNCRKKPNPHNTSPDKPALVASCSAFGPKRVGVVVRIASMTTESVYSFLRHQLEDLEPLIGLSPYC